MDPRVGQHTPVPLVGRRNEIRDLVAALRERRSRLVLGPPGAGKTRILEESLRRAGQPFVYVRRPAVLHDLLVALAEQLGCRPSHGLNLQATPSVTLKPLILEALRDSPRCVVLDDLAGADPRMCRFLREIYYSPGSCLVVAARSRDGLGYVRKLLWDPREQIVLRPLGGSDAQRLFAEAARAFRLPPPDGDDFRRKVLRAARGNPGQIVAMCRMAGRAEYWDGRRIKFLPLRMDVLSCFVP
jgi:hypothetical protein